MITSLNIWRFPEDSSEDSVALPEEVATVALAVPLAVLDEVGTSAAKIEAVCPALELELELWVELELETTTEDEAGEGAAEVLGVADELGVEDDDGGGATEEVVGA
jgi:hypothetical protein